MELELHDFERAAERLKPILHHTELDLSSTFSRSTGGQIYLKCENRQKTGSFKIRGASNKIACMIERGERCPVVASSAGNHAQGVAYASSRFGIPATIVMPKAAPIAKVQATEGYGAKVVLTGSCYDDAYNEALRICEEEGAKFLALEILGDLPTADIIIVPAGGGGLLAGMAVAANLLNPRVKVYGVQAEGAPAIALSFQQKKLVTTETAATIADGIAVKVPGDITVDLINKYAAGVVTVSEKEIANAILLLMERCKQIVEPAGATPLAAVLSGKIDVKGKRVVCLMSGGNVDVSFLQSIIEQGLVARNRRLKFVATLADRPGSLVQLLNILADRRANVLSIYHDQLYRRLNPGQTSVHVSCEVGGEEHGKAVIEAIAATGVEVEVEAE